MLTTDARHEIRAFTSLKFRAFTSLIDPDTKIWKLVSLELPLPYFLVDYAFRQENAWLSHTSLLSCEAVLVDLCRQFEGDPTRKIHQIAMLTPPAAQVPSAWTMVTIKEIREGLRAPNEGTALMFFGEDGGQIGSSSNSADECLTQLTNIVYAMPAR